MTTRFCLASQSPRRAALLRQAGYEFETVEPKVDEAMTPGEDPPSLTERLSMMKAVAAQKMLGHDSKMDVFLGSDTTGVRARSHLIKRAGMQSKAERRFSSRIFGAVIMA